jgi:hypothetical protein
MERQGACISCHAARADALYKDIVIVSNMSDQTQHETQRVKYTYDITYKLFQKRFLTAMQPLGCCQKTPTRTEQLCVAGWQ